MPLNHLNLTWASPPMVSHQHASFAAIAIRQARILTISKDYDLKNEEQSYHAPHMFPPV